MLKCQKDLFSLPENVTYLNGAYMSPLLKSVEMAGKMGLSRKVAPSNITMNEFFQDPIKLKKLFTKLTNADDFERIAIIPSVSYGMANVTKNIQAKAGQKILLIEEQFPSHVYCWQRMAEEQNLTIETIYAPENSENRAADWNESILHSIDENTAVVALSHVHWADGTLFDLETIGKKARANGALLIIDGTQSVGAFPFDIAKIKPDALVCGAYKWLMGPYTLGIAYYGAYFDNGVPIEENWINRHNSEDFQNLVNYQPKYKPKANRYCMGQQSNFINIPMQITALQQLLAWGVHNIQDYCRDMTREAVNQLGTMGCQIEHETHRASHLFGIRLPKHVDLEAVKIACTAANLLVSYRGNAIRVSPQVYNTAADMSKLVHILEKIINKA